MVHVPDPQMQALMTQEVEEYLAPNVDTDKAARRPCVRLSRKDWVITVNRTGVIHVPYICTSYVHI